MGVALKLYSPKMCVHAEMLGLERDERKIFRVKIHCGNNLSHSANGNPGSHEAKPALKWCFNV